MQHPINPYGKAKKMAEDIILDFSKKSDMAVMILRFFASCIWYSIYLRQSPDINFSFPLLLDISMSLDQIQREG